MTTSDLAWEIGVKGSGLWVVVPVGTHFNVSIPWLLHWIARVPFFPRWLRDLFDPHNPKYLKPSALHDYCLHVLKFGRVSAAAPFSDALKTEISGRLHRLLMVAGVIAWNWK